VTGARAAPVSDQVPIRTAPDGAGVLFLPLPSAYALG